MPHLQEIYRRIKLLLYNNTLKTYSTFYVHQQSQRFTMTAHTFHPPQRRIYYCQTCDLFNCTQTGDPGNSQEADNYTATCKYKPLNNCYKDVLTFLNNIGSENSADTFSQLETLTGNALTTQQLCD